LARPTPPPSAIASRAATGAGRPRLTMAPAATTPHKPKSAASDTSIPAPDSTTSASPIATIPTIEAWRSTVI